MIAIGLDNNQITRIQARRAFRQLKRGVCPDENIRLFTVGLGEELGRISDLIELVRSGQASCESCFLEAPYGGGKSHLLKAVECLALEAGFGVAQVTHDHYDRAFNHPPRYIHYIYENLCIPGLSVRGLGNMIPILLRSPKRRELLNWAETGGVRCEIGHHIRHMARIGTIADSYAHKHAIDCRDIRHRSGTAYYPLLFERLQTLADICRALSLSGLVVLFDEVESVATLLPNVRSRMRSYDILGTLSDYRAFAHCCFFFAVTPDFGHRIRTSDYPHDYDYYTNHYKHLYETGCRFMKAWVTSKLNTIEIGEISIAENEYLCHELARLHQYAFSWSSEERVSGTFIRRYLAEAHSRSMSQRGIVRCFVNLLDTCQQHASYDPSPNLSPCNASGPQSHQGSQRRAPSRDAVDELLLGLTPRQQRVVRLRFGLEDGTAHTLAQIASVFGVTRERVRQVQDEALEELRELAVSSQLAKVLESEDPLGENYATLLRAILQ